MEKELYAHSKKGRPVAEWQLLADHLSNVAQQAQSFATPFASGDWAWNNARHMTEGRAAL